jgi:hypothetical protein
MYMMCDLIIQRWNKPLRCCHAFPCHGVLLLELRSSNSESNLLQHLDTLKQVAVEKRVVQQVLAEDFAKGYRVDRTAMWQGQGAKR